MKTKPNEYDEPHNCPLCKTSLLDTEIPEEYKQSGNYYKREIGIEYPEKYDGVWHYKCPDCQGTFGGVEALK
jgi:hypothetical protein